MPTLIAGAIAVLVLYLLLRMFRSAKRGIRIVGGVGVVVVAAPVLYLFASWSPLSLYSTTYECSGVLTKASNKSGPYKLFIKVAQERWWVFLHPTHGVLRWESTGGAVPTIPDSDFSAVRFFQTGPNSPAVAPLFPGLFWGNATREDLFAIKRVDTFLDLYRWPKLGEAVDLTKSGQGQFSTIGNSLILNISDVDTFRGTCTLKDNP